MDVQLTFDDSYICYVSKIDVFLSSFVLVFTKGSPFSENFSLGLVHLEEKNEVQLTFDDSYLCYVIIDVF